MGFISALKNLHHSLIPIELRADGGTYICTHPHLDVAKQLVGAVSTGTQTWEGWGAMGEVMTGPGNLVECWIYGITVLDLLDQAGAAGTGTVDIAITMEAGALAPTTAQIEATISAYLACGVAGGPFAVYQPINPPIFIPRLTRIACAMNTILASKVATQPKCRVRLQTSRAKIQP